MNSPLILDPLVDHQGPLLQDSFKKSNLRCLKGRREWLIGVDLSNMNVYNSLFSQNLNKKCLIRRSKGFNWWCFKNVRIFSSSVVRRAGHRPRNVVKWWKQVKIWRIGDLRRRWVVCTGVLLLLSWVSCRGWWMNARWRSIQWRRIWVCLVFTVRWWTVVCRGFVIR